jgi:hypothetical protein
VPNRETFDDREKYDHSSHPTTRREKGDLAPAPNQGEKNAKTNDARNPDPGRSPDTPKGH